LLARAALLPSTARFVSVALLLLGYIISNLVVIVVVMIAGWRTIEIGRVRRSGINHRVGIGCRLLCPCCAILSFLGLCNEPILNKQQCF